MRNGDVNYRDPAYGKPGIAVCRNPECKKFIDNPGWRAKQAGRYRNMALRRYCTDKCFFEHREINRAGAAERVLAFLEKKGAEPK
jgi:hypothetical protein